MPKYVVELTVLLVLAGLASGCTGEVPSVGAVQTAEAKLTLPGEATPDAPTFNPFYDGPTTSVGRREVLENPSIAEVMKAGELPAPARRGAPSAGSAGGAR